jgi:L-asparaginase
VLADDGVTTLLRELDVPYYDPMTEKRMKEWVRQRRRDFDADMAQVVSGAGDEPGHGTIGVVARDTKGRLSAGTSTGGRGFEHVGRVSDSAMPAGNYANEHAAVSCTGIGEDIIDDCAAARLVIRATDGVPLREAFERTFEEADEADHSYAAIAVGADGQLAWGKTTETLLAAWHDGRRRDQTLNLAEGRIVESRAGR